MASTMRFDNWQTTDGTSIATTNASGDITFAGAVAGAGKILQVVSAYKSDTFTTTSATLVDITGLSVNITPTSTSSKILVMSQTSVGSPSATNFTLRIVRDSTEISKIIFSRHFGTALDSFTLATVDSPATTSTTTYKNQIAVGAGSVNVNVGSNAFYEGTSSIIVMEIAG